MYGHPLLKYPIPLLPDTVVEHRWRPGIPLVIVSGPHRTELHQETYIVRVEGREVRVVRENLRI